MKFYFHCLFIELLWSAGYHSLRESKGESKKRGIVICASESQSSNLIDTLHFIRNKWKSELPITIAHCNEILNTSDSKYSSYSINFLNICRYRLSSFNSIQDQTKRLKSFFCKPAALVSSPFQETMIVDVDILWFNQLDLLFEAPGYIRTGALFFRDRFITFETDFTVNSFIVVNNSRTISFIESELGTRITPLLAERLFQKNGISFFWKHFSNPLKYPALKHVQDSSVILIDKVRHSGMLAQIVQMLPTFSLGYGDKEIYWIAATVAKEEFAWEPHLAGIYGDCGAIIHFDPRITTDVSRVSLTGSDKAATTTIKTTTVPYQDNPTVPASIVNITNIVSASSIANPFFMNAEYLLECFNDVGQGMEDRMTIPIHVTNETKIFNLGNTDPYTKGRCGACSRMRCSSTPTAVNAVIREAQQRQARQKGRTLSTNCFVRLLRKFKRRRQRYRGQQRSNNTVS